GVPFLQALECAAGELAEPERSRALRVRAGYRERCTAASEPSFTAMMHEAGLLSPLVLQLFAVGEETGRLDVLMDRAAEALEHEVLGELNAVLAMG
ncbi:MAG: type II secretion system F family protein, partial [Armatimonadetes bacterium]|nr:type II secretion system F family protein [Armatimonadota bacterium]